MSGALSQSITKQIQTLRETGHTVNIYHVRYFPNLAEFVATGEYNHYMTHKQFLKAVENGSLVNAEGQIISNKQLQYKKFEQEVSPFDGETRIEIKKGDVVIAYGHFKQSILDKNGLCLPFTRRIGFQAAWGRTVKRMLGRSALKNLKAEKKAEKKQS